MLEFLGSMHEVDADLEKAGDAFASIRSNLATQLGALEKATGWIMKNGLANPNDALAGSSPLVRMWGIVLGGWLLARSAVAAVDTADAEEQFVLAHFYATQILPQAAGLRGAVTAGAGDLFALDDAALGTARA